jgi:hypothetical protein
MRGEPDADALAEITGPRRLTKAAPVDPVLGLVTPPPARPTSTPVWAAPAAAQERAEQAYAAAGVEAPRPAPAPASTADTVLRRKQGGYYAHQADVDRARAAWAHTQLLPGGYASWSEFQLAAVMRLTEEMETSHNHGRPFPPLPAGKVKHSRRTGD